jgi:tetratricopeptide (TPR) repeat protein
MRAGVLLFNKGDLALAEEQFERCSELAMELGSGRDQARATYPLAVIKHLRGERAEAEQLGEQARAAFERTGETFFQIQNLVALAQFALARDDPVAAEERLREALPLALDEGSWFAADVYRHLAEALVRQGRVEEARELVAVAAERVPEQHPWAQACHHCANGAVAAASGDARGASEHFDRALALLAELDVPIELCQARLAYARALRAAGDAAAAAAQLALAREAAVALGAAGLAEEAELELAASEGGAGGAGPTLDAR